jgi:hypothetical protein
MKKTALALALIFSFLFSAVIGTQFTNSAAAETYSTITIKPDGSIEGTDKIQRQGDVYTLISDVFGSIEVQKSSIVIDGAGHTLQGRKGVNERGVYLVGPDRSHPVCGNVLVKNLRISNFFEGIFVLGASNNSIIGNFLDNSGIHLIGSPNNIGDLIKHNTLSGAGIFVDYNSGGIDVITENNFIDCTIFVDLSKPPIVDKNYWSNYTAEYPNAKELDNSGTWDTPYVYDKFVGGSHGNDPCIDYHPLMQPIEVPAFPDITAPAVSVVSPENKTYASSNVSLAFGIDEPIVWAGYSLDGGENVTVTGNTTLTELPNGLHSVVVYANDTFGNMGRSEAVTFTVDASEPFPTTLVIASVGSVAIVGLGLLVYFKKRKKESVDNG